MNYNRKLSLARWLVKQIGRKGRKDLSICLDIAGRRKAGITASLRQSPGSVHGPVEAIQRCRVDQRLGAKVVTGPVCFFFFFLSLFIFETESLLSQAGLELTIKADLEFLDPSASSLHLSIAGSQFSFFLYTGR